MKCKRKTASNSVLNIHIVNGCKKLNSFNNYLFITFATAEAQALPLNEVVILAHCARKSYVSDMQLKF